MTTQRTRRNIFFKGVGETSRLGSALLFILIGRLLGGEKFGAFSLALALSTFLVTTADSGLNQLLIRDIAREKSRAAEFIATTAGIKFLLAPVILALMAGLMTALHYHASLLRLGLLCAGISVTKNWIEFLFAICNGFEKMQYESAFKWFNQIASVVVGGALLWKGTTVNQIAGALVGVNGATLLSAYVVLRRDGIAPRSLSWDGMRWVGRWKESFPLAVSIMFNALFFRIDIILLSVLGRSSVEIGQFAASVRILEAVGVLPALVASALFPILADHQRNQFPAFRAMFRKWTVRMAGLALGTALLVAVSAGLVIRVTFGQEYLLSGFLLRLLALSFPALFLNYLGINSLIIMGQQRLVAVGTVGALAANALANMVLIPRFGTPGACAAVWVGQTAMCAFAYYHLAYRNRLTHRT